MLPACAHRLTHNHAVSLAVPARRYLEKRGKRVWTKKVKYDVRKNFADSRLRVKGRFVKKEDEALLRELIHMT